MEDSLPKSLFRGAGTGRYVTVGSLSGRGTKVIEGSRGERVITVNKSAAASALSQAASKIGRNSDTSKFTPKK